MLESTAQALAYREEVLEENLHLTQTLEVGGILPLAMPFHNVNPHNLFTVDLLASYLSLMGHNSDWKASALSLCLPFSPSQLSLACIQTRTVLRIW